MPRRTHQKSRKGCLECKKRHVKCDESRPRCVQCVTAERKCEYANIEPAGPAGHGPVANGDSNSTASTSSEHTDTFQGRLPALTFAGLNFVHLELLHHFSTSTYKTFSPEIPQQDLWQHTAIKHGLEYPFLMYELLAIAALHLGHLTPQKRQTYFTRAVELQSQGLSEFQAIQQNINKDSASAIFLFSSLLSLHVFADPVSADSASPGDYLDHFLQSVKLMQGVRSPIIHDWWEHLSRTDLAALFKIPQVSKPYQIPRECFDLDKLIFDDPQAEKACEPAIERLQWLFAICEVGTARKHDTIRWLLAWPAQLDKSYLAELDRRGSQALIVLAHYAALLHFYQRSWAVRNTGHELLLALESILGPGYDQALKWPKDMISLPVNLTSMSDNAFAT